MEEKESSQADTSGMNSQSGSPPKSLPFITTSDVLNHLNKNLKELVAPGEEHLDPRFELQKKLPDGSTIPASESDMSASDLQNKIQQSAKFVAQLRRDDKLKWASQQRQSGNVLFERGEYKAAMDIYLTCLVVKETDKEADVSFLSETLLPVLNNLAQCTLQLGMQKKTTEFCNIAIDEISKAENCSGFPMLNPVAVCRIYFKRAKAQRLSGDYYEARQDLNRSLECLEKKDEADGKSPFQQAIQKEFRHLETAEKEARKNKQRQKRAMQKALASKYKDNNLTTSHAASHSTGPLSDLAAEETRPRQYSTLRVRKKSAEAQDSERKKEDRTNDIDLSYWQFYWLLVARVAEGLLLLLSDDETIKALEEQEKDE